MSRPAGMALAIVLATVGTLGCDQDRTADSPPESGLWIGPTSVPLTRAAQGELGRLGVGELYVERGRLVWSREGPQVVAIPPPEVAGRTRAVSVVAGTWPAEPVDPEATAAALLEGVAAALSGLDAPALVPVGLHLDLVVLGELEALAEMLEEVRDGLDDGLRLSLSMRPFPSDDEDLEGVLREVDLLVPFVYGQRLSERERSEAWDFQQVRSSIDRLEALEVPYLLGLVTLGSARLLDRSGGEIRTLRGDLRSLVWDRRLELVHGFTLEGIDRQVYSFQAKGGFELEGERVEKGQKVRVVATSVPHLEELRRRLAEWAPVNCLGSVYYKIPSAEDVLSVTPEALADAIDELPALPSLAVELRALEHGPRGGRFELTLSNRSREATDVSFLDYNQIEITAQGGRFGRVDVGEFYRFDLLRPGRDGALERTLRNPTVLRLYAPYVEGGMIVTGGAVEVVGRGADLTLLIGGTFLAPYGRTVKIYRELSWAELASGEGASAPTTEPE